MKTKALLFALLLFVCQFASAQSQDSIAFYRHHIGINTRVVLDKAIDPASRMPLQLMYKYQLSRTGAIRIGLEGMYSKSDSTQSFTNRHDEITDYLFGGSIGYEWQKQLSKRFMLYYGADGFYRQNGRNIEIINNYPEPSPSQTEVEIYIDNKLTTKTTGLRPFVGLRANIGKRFYLSSETALVIQREHVAWKFEDYIKFSSPEGGSIQPGSSDYTTKKSTVSYLPFSGINIQYLF